MRVQDVESFHFGDCNVDSTNDALGLGVFLKWVVDPDHLSANRHTGFPLAQDTQHAKVNLPQVSASENPAHQT